MKKTLLTLLLVLILALTACGTEAVTLATENITTTTTTPQTTSSATLIEDTPTSADFKDDDLTSASTGAGSNITLNGDSIEAGAGVTVNGSTATITVAGVYEISGMLGDGQIIVDTQDTENVTLLLAGVDIHNEKSAPIYVANAEKVIITLAEGTQNNLSDGATYYYPDESDEPNATLFSKDDLTINGTGSLNVTASYNNGIASKDDLKIASGTITVNATNDGIKGKDSVAILAGNITISAGADGLQSTNAEDAGKGYIVIEGGTLNIIAGLDGLQAETSLLVSDGVLEIVTGGGSVSSTSSIETSGRRMEGNPNQTEDSVKGLKAGVDLTISGGDISINSLDDALHSNSTLTINAGNLNIASGDDAVHADDTLTINGGTLNVTESYEGLESQIITINDGNIHIIASDDSINATDGGGGGIGGPGVEYGDNYVYINGGYLYMNSGSDGLDSNGNFEMTGGMILVDGPTTDFEGPLDYGASFKITGGFLVAVGSAGMAQAPSDDSTQYAVVQILDSMQAAGTLIHIETVAGEDVLTFQPSKEYQSVVFSSPNLQNGESYVVYTGGNSTGTPIDGLITAGNYTSGTLAANFTIMSIITGEGMGGFPGGRPGEGGPGGERPPRP